MNHQDINTIARLMCDATMTILDPAFKSGTYINDYCLSARVGSGKATNHCSPTRSSKKCVITYGVKMIEDKLVKVSAEGWTTGKEIISRGYFGGKVTYKNLIAATVLHEFAHHIQVKTKGRVKGSVHNSCFYSILDSFYEKNLHIEVMEYMEKSPVFLNAEFENEEACKFDSKSMKGDTHFDFYSTKKGKMITLKIVKLNPTRAVGVTENNPVSKGKTTVPYHMIKKSYVMTDEIAVERLNEAAKEKEQQKVKASLRKQYDASSILECNYIFFEISRQEVKAKIIRVNVKTVTAIIVSDGARKGDEYKVPFHLITNATKDAISVEDILVQSPKQEQAYSKSSLRECKSVNFTVRNTAVKASIQRLNLKTVSVVINDGGRLDGQEWRIPYCNITNAA